MLVIGMFEGHCQSFETHYLRVSKKEKEVALTGEKDEVNEVENVLRHLGVVLMLHVDERCAIRGAW